jgi:membrane fusion protein, heavy metal efflux system
MEQNRNRLTKQWFAVIVVFAIGALLAAFILLSDKPKQSEDEGGGHSEAGHSDETAHEDTKEISSLGQDAHLNEHIPQAAEIAKGPHGGKFFTQDGYGLEVTIFEEIGEPVFRVYTYQDNKPLNPSSSLVTIRLERLGSKPQLIAFSTEKDYLKSNAVIEEPHSFKVHISARNMNKQYEFSYEQVEGRTMMSDKQLTLNSIEVLTAAPAKIKSSLVLQGEIKLNADKSVQILPRVGGIVETVTANAGDKVRKGQILASISSQSIADMRSDLLAAQNRVSLAKSTYQREKQLWEEKISAEQDYLQAQNDLQEAEINTQRIRQKLGAVGAGNSGSGQARYEIRSPIDGVVTNKQVSLGQVVTETNNLFEVADLSTVWAEMTIYAKDINTVKAGQEVKIKSTAFDAKTTGTISYVGALVGASSRTAMARVVLNNPERIWLPGVPVSIELTANEVEVPLAISVEAIQTLNDSTVAFGRYGEYFEAKPLELGRRDDTYVEVIRGLNLGDKYAAGNSFLIKADIGKAGASHEH